MRKWILFLLMLLVPCVAFSGQEERNFLVLLPLQGNGAEQGEACRIGFEMGRAKLESRGLKVNLRYEDTAGNPSIAISGYRAAQAQAKPSVLFSWGSGVGMALSPVVNADKVIQIGVATATPKYRSLHDYNFRISPSADFEANYLVRAIFSQLQFTSIAAIYVENDYGLGSFEAALSAMRSFGKEFVTAQPYPPETTDFKPLLLRILESKADLVYLSSYPSDGALLLKQARQIGIKAKFVSSVAIAGAQEFFNIAGEGAEGLLLTSHWYDERHQFFTEFQKKHGDMPIPLLMYVARSYDAILIAENAHKGCATTDPECIRKNLCTVDYSGPLGHLTFDAAGDTVFQYELYQVQSGKLARLAQPRLVPAA